MISLTATIILSTVILAISFFMAMVGKGGGNFYILAMLFAGIPIYNASTASQMIMLATAITSMVVFNKNKRVDWLLALVIDPPTDIMAFFGGYLANRIHGNTLKIIFAILLIIVSLIMFLPVKDRKITVDKKIGYWKRNFGNSSYVVNLWIALPTTAVVGFFAGALGVSGGTFKIPLMVLACGVPMEIAIGTSSAMVAVTAFMGLLGHSLSGDFNPQIVFPLTAVAVIGGLFGSKFALKRKPKNLKKIFAIINLAGALIMLVSLI